MTIRYDRPVSRAANLARTIARLGLMMFVLAVLAHRFGPMSTPSMLAFLLLSALLSVLAMLLATSGLVSLWFKGAKAGKASAAAIFMAAIPLLPPVLAAGPLFSLPMIHDITTDVTDPPAFLTEPDAGQGWLPVRPAVSFVDRVAQRKAYPGLTGRRYDGALDRVLVAVRKVAAAEGIRIVDEQGGPEPLSEIVPDDKAAAPADNAALLPGADQPVTDSPDIVPVPLPRPEPDPQPEAEVAKVGSPGDVLLQGDFRSTLFGFHSDVVIRLREEAETTLVDMRVNSRYGRHDLGAGNGVIQSFLKALDAELLGIAGD